MLMGLLIAAGALATPESCACGPVVQGTPARLAESAWVFLGQLTDRVQAKDASAASPARAWGWSYPVKVTRTWKDRRTNRGAVPSVLVLDWCAAEVRVGAWYVFFADERGTVSRCRPPVPRDEGAKLIRELDAATKEDH